MANKRSLTILGLVVGVIGVVLDKIGVPVLEGQIESFLTIALQVIGVIGAAYGRYRQGDITIFGKKKVKTTN